MRSNLYKFYTAIRKLFESLGIMSWADRSRLVVKLARWARERIVGSELVLITHPIDGYKLKLNSDYIDLIQGKGYESGTTKIFTEIIKEGMTVVDIGANLGYYTLAAAKRVGDNGRVYAFEPDPGNFRILEENIKLNNYRNIVPVQEAISDKQGSARLFLGLRASGTHSLVSSRDYGEKSISVSTTTLDYFLERQGNPQIHVIKMDIEGWEPEALEGMRKLITRSRPLTLIMEFYPWGLLGRGMRPLALTSKLMELGFELSVIDEETGQAMPFAEYHCGQAVEFVEKNKGSVNLLCQK